MAISQPNHVKWRHKFANMPFINCAALLQVETASSDMQDLQQQYTALELTLKQAPVTPLSRRMV